MKQSSTNVNYELEQAAIEERAKYVAAFNDTMIKIWQEQITLLGVIDTASCCALL